MEYTNLEDFIKNGRNLELPTHPEIQIAPEGDEIVLYVLTPEETPVNYLPPTLATTRVEVEAS